jgi:hypothetical protein
MHRRAVHRAIAIHNDNGLQGKPTPTARTLTPVRCPAIEPGASWRAGKSENSTLRAERPRCSSTGARPISRAAADGQIRPGIAASLPRNEKQGLRGTEGSALIYIRPLHEAVRGGSDTLGRIALSIFPTQSPKPTMLTNE